MTTHRLAQAVRGIILLFALYIGALSLGALMHALHGRGEAPPLVAILASAELIGCIFFAWPRFMWLGAGILSVVFLLAIAHHAAHGPLPLPLLAYLLLTLALAIIAHRAGRAS